MAIIDDNNILEALACAVEQVPISPLHNHLCVTSALNKFPSWYFWFELRDDVNNNPTQQVTRKINRVTWEKRITSYGLSMPVGTMYEALILAHFFMSNRDHMQKAELVRISSKDMANDNLWCVTYQYNNDENLWMWLHIKIDVHTGIIFDVNSEPQRTLNATTTI